MKISSVTEEQIRHARVDGYKRKAPAKPKKLGKASSDTLDRWIERYNAWSKEVKQRAAKGKVLATARDQVRNAKR